MIVRLTLTLSLCLHLLGCSSSADAPAENLAPYAGLKHHTIGPVGLSTRFDASTSGDEDGRVVRYRFVFGDGGQEVVQEGSVARRTFQAVGSYGVRVCVEDDQGSSACASSRITITQTVIPRCASDTDCELGTCQQGACTMHVCSDSAACELFQACQDGQCVPTAGEPQPDAG